MRPPPIDRGLLFNTGTVASAVRRAQRCGRSRRWDARLGGRAMRGAPLVQSPGPTLRLDHALGQFDTGVEASTLLVPRRTWRQGVDIHDRFVAEPLDINSDRCAGAVRSAKDIGRIVEQHAVGLVAEDPPAERNLAVVIGPQFVRLQLEPLPQTGTVEFLHIQVGTTAACQSGPVVESPTTHLEADEPREVCLVVDTPPPPALDRCVGVPLLVGVGARCHSGQTRCVIRYLSLDWFDALTAAVAADDALQQLAASHTIGVTQVVTDGPEGDVTYHLQVGDGTASFGAGGAEPEHVRMQQTWDTAVGVATGTLNAQKAFIEGRILLTGDQQRLMEAQPVFGALDAVFRAIRERTEYR